MASVFLKRIFVGIILLSGILSVQININPPITTTVGKSNIEIKCELNTDNEIIFSISIKAYNTSTSEYNVIATFYSSVLYPPLLTENGKYLENRVSLTTNTSNFASILFHEIRCEDDNTYICSAYFDKNGVPKTQESSSTSLTIKSPSSKPDIISSYSNLNETESGHDVTFTCEGNVGKPPGKFVWKKYSADMNTSFVFSNIITASIEDYSMCSYFGSSNFTVQLSDEDNGATIACVEERHVKTTDMEIRINKINVYYPVKEVKISKDPDMIKYTAGQNSHINLQCSAKGNPKTQFFWYKDGDRKNNISTLDKHSIRELSVNTTGSYMCVAYNMFKGNTYNISANVNITVVEKTFSKTGKSTTSDAGNNNIYIAIGVVVFCVLIVLISIFCYRRCKRKRSKNSNRNEDVVLSSSDGHNGNQHGLALAKSSNEYSEMKFVNQGEDTNEYECRSSVQYATVTVQNGTNKSKETEKSKVPVTRQDKNTSNTQENKTTSIRTEVIYATVDKKGAKAKDNEARKDTEKCTPPDIPVKDDKQENLAYMANEGQDNNGNDNFTLPDENQIKNTATGDDYQKHQYPNDANENLSETKHFKL